MKDRYIATVDLGTSKLALSVAKITGEDVQILYYKETPSDGVRYGRIYNPIKASVPLKEALAGAEEAGEDAREIARLNKDDFAKFEKIRSKKTLAIDDMGLEPAEVMDYGNILNPVVDLLSYRYDEQLFTIVTTNLKPEEIRQKYGDRIADRFNEMMERIIFYNGSYRG